MRRRTLLKLLAHHINKAEPGTATFVAGPDDERTTLKVEGVNVGYLVRLKDERRRRHPSRSEPYGSKNGRQRVYIGVPGQLKRFHQDKNGYVNLEGAAKALVELRRKFL